MPVAWLASHPRSGNRWMRHLLTSAGVESYSSHFERAEKPMPGTAAELHARPGLYVIKTHDLPRSDSFPAILLVRDGRDCAVSFAGMQSDPAPEHLRHGARIGLQRHLATSGEWSRMNLAWADRSLVIRYEDMLENEVREAQRVLAYLGVSGTITPPDFAAMHARNPHYYRVGRSGQWREKMPLDVQREFWRVNGPTMLRFGYREN